MKKITFLLAALLTVSASFSQQRKKVRKANQITAEQRATLAAKKLTLALDLDESQAKRVKALYADMAKKRMKKVKERKDKNADTHILLANIKKSSKSREEVKRKIEKAIKEGKLKKEDLRKMKKRRGQDFEAQNKALDHKITLQRKMKKILTKGIKSTDNISSLIRYLFD